MSALGQRKWLSHGRPVYAEAVQTRVLVVAVVRADLERDAIDRRPLALHSKGETHIQQVSAAEAVRGKSTSASDQQPLSRTYNWRCQRERLRRRTTARVREVAKRNRVDCVARRIAHESLDHATSKRQRMRSLGSEQTRWRQTRTTTATSLGAERKSDATRSGMWSIVIASATMRVGNLTESFPLDPAMPQQLPISIVSCEHM